MRHPWSRTAAALVLAAFTTALGCGGSGGEANQGITSQLTIYLTDEEGVQLDCAAVRPSQVTISAPRPTDLPSAAVRLVIRDIESSITLHPDGARPLGTYFTGIRVEGRTAIVSFDGGALAYLNSTACIQAVAKTPIVRTLLEFPGIDDVVWEIDGEIFTAWDA